MTKAFLMLFGLLAPALQDGRDAKLIIDNNRVTVREITAGSGHLGSRDHDAEVNTISFGLTKFNAPNRSHSEELVKGSADAIMVELK